MIPPARVAALAFADPRLSAPAFADPRLLPSLVAARLLPFLAWRARARGLDPGSLYGANGAAVRSAARATLARNLQLFAALDRALASLRAAGVVPALLKGAALVAEGIYPIDARPMSDADLLVPPGEFEAARAALRGAGFAEPDPPGPEDAVTNFAGEAGENLGLHRALLPAARYFGPAFALPAAPFLARSREMAPARALDPTDTLFHLAAHLTLCHGFDGPVQMIDVARFAQARRRGIDPARLSSLLLSCGAAPGVASLFDLLERHGFGRFSGLLTARARGSASAFHRLAAAAAFRLAFGRPAPHLHAFVPWLLSPAPGAALRMAARHARRTLFG